MGVDPQEQVNAVQSKEAVLRMQATLLRQNMQFALRYGNNEDVAEVEKGAAKFNAAYPDFRVNLKPYPFKTQFNAERTGGIANTRGQVNIYYQLMGGGDDD